jgi:ribosomal protein S18 acetylase RimI-like enzyme
VIVPYNNNLKEIAIELGRKMHLESRFSKFSYDPETVIRLLNSPSIFCKIAFQDELPIGFFVGMVQQMWFSTDKAGYDLALYVVPEKRGGMTAVRLIREFEKFCKENNCVTINLGAGAEISNDSAKRLYTKLGYKECGFLSHKEI